MERERGVGNDNISTGSEGGDTPAGCGVTSCCMISDAGSLRMHLERRDWPGWARHRVPRGHPPPNSRKAHLSLD